MSIVAKSLSYIHPNGVTLFQHLSLSLGRGQHAALVGPNGAGKSTLLQILAGTLAPTTGDVSRAEKPYYVPQHLGQFDHLTVAEALGVAPKLAALHAILGGDAAPAHFTALDDDWEIEERVGAALAYWQLPPLPLAQPLRLLSGGEKTKVFLAGIQLHAPGLVLLDEPSNHLDAGSRARLYVYLEQAPETLLVVSHDRALLNRLDLTLELSPHGLTTYGGNYDFYQQQRAGQLAALQAQRDEKEKTLRQTQQKARDLAEQRHKQEVRGKAHGQKQGLPRIVAGNLQRQAEQSSAQLREVQQDRLDGLADDLRQLRQQIQARQPLKIDLRRPGLHRGKILVELEHANVTLADRPLWPAPLSLQLRSGERVRVSGPNGAGKTTLLRLLTGQLPPSTGRVFVGEFSYLYVDQEYSVIRPELTVVEQVQLFNARQLPEHELKTLLHYHQLGREYWDRKGRQLSGGEKLKLLLCCLAVGNNAPDLLLLDEPTNNLDLDSQQVLTAAVRDFAGTVLLISHDEYFTAEIGVERTVELG